MAKTKISEFSATPANNTDIDSINIAEGCAPSGINDAIRELMAQLKDFQTGAVGDSFNGPVGTSTAAAGAFTTLAASGAVTLSGGTANGVTYLNGSKVLTSGSALTFDGTNLGVGTSSPNFESGTGQGIQVNYSGGLGAHIKLTDSASGSGATDGFDLYAYNTNGYIENYEAGATIFRNNGSEQMRLTSTGLGIGTSSPTKKLDVVITDNTLYAVGDTAQNINVFNLSTTNGTYSSIRLGAQGSGSAGIVNLYAIQTAGTGSADFAVVNRNAGTFQENLRVTSAGNVGIGTNSPSNRVSIVTASGSDGIVSVKSPTTETAGVVIDGGTSSNKGSVLKFSKDATVKWQMGTDSAIIGGTTDNFHLYGGGANAILFSTNATERARIDSSGNLLVASTNSSMTTGTGIKLAAAGGGVNTPTLGIVGDSSNSGQGSYHLYSSSLGQYQFYVTYSGNIYARSTSITGLSDISEKENIRDLETGLNSVLALQPRRFDWKNGSGTNVAGFIAQEVQSVLPDLVESYKISDEENKLGLKMGDMIPTLVKAIQEQNQIIQQLQADVAALKGN